VRCLSPLPRVSFTFPLSRTDGCVALLLGFDSAHGLGILQLCQQTKRYILTASTLTRGYLDGPCAQNVVRCIRIAEVYIS
jgi:hypothetical protein